MVRAGAAPGTVVRCGLTDTMLADVPVSLVLFFERELDVERLADGLAKALDRVPVFAGRLRTMADRRLEIVCVDEGVPFSVYDVAERSVTPSAGLRSPARVSSTTSTPRRPGSAACRC